VVVVRDEEWLVTGVEQTQDGALPVGMKKANFSDADLDDALLRERSLLYVAATRARDVLAVSYHGAKSPLLG